MMHTYNWYIPMLVLCSMYCVYVYMYMYIIWRLVMPVVIHGRLNALVALATLKVYTEK